MLNRSEVDDTMAQVIAAEGEQKASRALREASEVGGKSRALTS